MRKLIWMHNTESGFDSVEEAKAVKRYSTDPEYRLVEIIVDEVTENIANNEHKYELEEAYVRGKEAAKQEFRSKLGL